MRTHRSLCSLAIRLIALTLSYLLLLATPGIRFAARGTAAAPIVAHALVAATGRQPRSRPGELLVRFTRNLSEQAKDALVAGQGAQRARRLRGRSGLEQLRLRAGQTPEALAALLRGRPGIELAEPNYLIAPADVTPNDARFAEQWALRNTGASSNSQAGADINAPAAWDSTVGTAQTVVAVVDSGIDFTHPDLANNIWTNAGTLTNGDLHGWDYVTDSPVIVDAQGHGTAIAGLIAAEGNNNVGITGVLWHASLMSLRVLDNTGSGSIADAVEAIDYASAHGAQVINCSWGTDGDSQALRDAISGAAERNVVVVASAGNDARDIDATPYYPAAYATELPNVISVAATDNADQLAAFSNWGATRVTVAAPGVALLTTKSGGDYQSVSGTSAAAPLVSGVVGLLKTLRPWLLGTEVRQAISSGARPVSALAGKVAAHGVLSAPGALAAMPGTDTPPVSGTPTPTPTPPPPLGNMGDLGAHPRQPPPTSQPPLYQPIRANFLPADGPDGGGRGHVDPPGGDPDFATRRTQLATQTGQAGVTLGSRNFNWAQPLVHLPGRAGLDLDLTLYYNSLLWTKQDNSIEYNADRGTPAAGFRLGFPVVQRRYINEQTGQYAFLLLTPSGGRVELSATGTAGVYEARDGSYMQLTDTNGNGGQSGVVVLTADGTRLTFNPPLNNQLHCTEIKDRNGNYLTINYNGDGQLTSVTDTLGRQVDFNYVDGNLASITQMWSGAPHTWATFSYGSVPVQPNFPGLAIYGANNRHYRE